MEFDLEPDELRVLGCLMEKETTTPDQYPLSVNALVNACNQKSARDPVMSMNPGDVRAALGRLTRRGLARMAGSYGGRVSRYEHRLRPGSGTPLELDREQFALLCVLILRGPQTPGELRARSQRLAEFADVEAVEACLERLQEHAGGALVARLPREPGKRESRYRHLLGVAADLESDARPESSETVTGQGRDDSLEDRVAALEREVARLRSMIER